MNKVLDTIKTRYSCRMFTKEMPEDSKIKAIANAALKAPSAMNLMPWQIIVLRNSDIISELEVEALNVLASMEDKTMYERIQSRGGKLFYDAPCIMLIATEKSDPTRSARDCGIVCQNITLAAHSLELGSCICGLINLAFTEEKVAYFYEKLKVPANYEINIGVLIGVPNDFSPSHDVNLDKLTYIN